MKTMPKARSLGGSTVGPLGMLKDRVNTQTELLDLFLKKRNLSALFLVEALYFEISHQNKFEISQYVRKSIPSDE